MRYKCKQCDYVFEVATIEHPHTSMYGGSRFGAYGCPVCQRMATMPKVCPQCLSLDVEQIL